MTATQHIAVPHHPLTTLTAWLRSRLRRHPAAQAGPVDYEVLRQSFPPAHTYRHDLEAPDTEDVFAHLAIDHPDEVAVAAMRPADREQHLLAVCDEWFRHAHPAPQHRWSPQQAAEYEQLLGSVRACFHPGGAA